MAYYKKGWGKLRKSADYMSWACFFKSRKLSASDHSYSCRFPADKMELLPVLRYDITSVSISWKNPEPGNVNTEVHITW